jgi:hypothetical protein
MAVLMLILRRRFGAAALNGTATAHPSTARPFEHEIVERMGMPSSITMVCRQPFAAQAMTDTRMSRFATASGIGETGPSR